MAPFQILSASRKAAGYCFEDLCPISTYAYADQPHQGNPKSNINIACSLCARRICRPKLCGHIARSKANHVLERWSDRARNTQMGKGRRMQYSAAQTQRYHSSKAVVFHQARVRRLWADGVEARVWFGEGAESTPLRCQRERKQTRSHRLKRTI